MDEIIFLAECYFGDITDPLIAAIDRAYLDMQAHTVNGEKIDLFDRRKKLTELLYEEISSLNQSTDFNKWHKTTIKNMRSSCKGKNMMLSYGQCQKWLNMSVKYLYVMKQIGIPGISEAFEKSQVAKFHAPLDSYVLNALNEKDVTWSSIDSYEQYERLEKKITFLEELKNWPEYRRNANKCTNGNDRLPDKGSYKRYVIDNGGYSFRK